jgi:hypothetical protein
MGGEPAAEAAAGGDTAVSAARHPGASRKSAQALAANRMTYAGVQYPSRATLET